MRPYRYGIQTQGPIYANSELQTRYGLIDPVLRALEWDVSNPDEVGTEYPAGSGKADYVLMHQGKPLVVIEAKALGTQLKNATSQAAAYCKALGAPYLVCTDGNVWNLVQLSNSGNVSIEQLRILSSEAYEAAQGLLFLWKPVRCSSVQKIPRIFPSGTAKISNRTTKKKRGKSSKSKPVPPPTANAISLPNLLVQLASGWNGSLSYIHFPPIQNWIPIKSYRDILTETVKFVASSGNLPASGVRTVLIPSGSPLRNPQRYSQVNSWFVCTHGSAKQLVEYAIRVLQACSLNPHSVYVS